MLRYLIYHVVVSSSSASSIPFPTPLKMGGDTATDWKRFRCQWENYEITADLADQPTKKSTAIFLACIGSEAYQLLFHTLQFAEETDRQDIEKVTDAFQRHCIGEVNVT